MSVEHLWPNLADDGITKVVITEDCVLRKAPAKRYRSKSEKRRIDKLLRVKYLDSVTSAASEKAVVLNSQSVFDAREKPADTLEWTDPYIWESFHQLSQGPLDLENASQDAKYFWTAIQSNHRSRPHDLHRLAEELRIRHLTIQEFFQAYRDSKLDQIDLEGILAYMDFQIAMVRTKLASQQNCEEIDDDYGFDHLLDDWDDDQPF